MFGWEFPPLNSGGLGTACYGLTRALSKKGVNVLFVLPRVLNKKPDFLNLVSLDLPVIGINSSLMEYSTSRNYPDILQKFPSRGIYGKNLFEEVYNYTQKAKKLASGLSYDIIHAHDWMTFQAGVAAKEISKKPLVLHVHSTEWDRTGGNNVNQYVYTIEKEAMKKADCIIAVSNFTKKKIIEHYSIEANKIQVVHNSIDIEGINHNRNFDIKKHYRIALFLGRITLQKGPDYYLYAAKKVLEIADDVRFIIAGSGDMERSLMEKAASMGISDKVLFMGFLRGEELNNAYRMADVFVMPSVSEPFGLTALEAMSHSVPVIISKQSGVCEVVRNCLKTDFWDVNELANKIVSVLDYQSLHKCLTENSTSEIKNFSWEEPAQKCITIYNNLLN